MYLGIVFDEKYSHYIWFNDLYTNLIKVAKEKRLYYKTYSSIEALSNETDIIKNIVIIGEDIKWLNEFFPICFQKAENIIRYVNGNLKEIYSNFRCNYISSDITYSVSQAFSYLESNNKSSTALYGINKKSLADNHMEQLYSKKINFNDVYYNEGNLEKCFEDFSHNIEKYDSIICANDYSAISLLRNLTEHYPEKVNDLFIISYSDFSISKYSSPSISTFSLNFSEFGRATMFICDYFDDQNSNKDSTLSIKIPCVFKSRSTTKNLPMNDYAFSTSFSQIESYSSSFGNDSEVVELTRLETLINKCDETDKKIIRLLLSKNSMSNIADSLFISRPTLTYRISRLLKICNFNNKDEIIELIKKYNITL